MGEGPRAHVLRGWPLLGATLLVLACAGVGRGAGMTAVARLLARDVPLESDGLALAGGMLVASSLAGLALFGVLRAREPRRYLALEAPPLAHLGVALAGAAVLSAAFGAARLATTGSLVPDAWAKAAASAPLPVLLPALTLALTVAAPCFEEAFFRGFLHTSLRETRLGVLGTTALTSTLFALAHGPDGLLSLLEPLASAVFLSILRERTRSIVPGIAAHALGNAVAIVLALRLA